MVTYIFSNECIVFQICGTENFTLRDAVNCACKSKGLESWHDIEAELFEMGENCLVIVRPRPPRTKRFENSRPRLFRI